MSSPTSRSTSSPTNSTMNSTPNGPDTTSSGMDVQAVLGDARERIAKATTLDELRALERELLGKQSQLAALRQAVKSLAPELRPQAGQEINAARETIAAEIAARRQGLEAEVRRAQLEADRLDLTEVLPGPDVGHLHLVTQATEDLENVFVGMGFTVEEGPEVETDWHNFGALNFPEGHPARDLYDTFYVHYGPPGSTLLRTHTSPVQVRVMTGRPPPYYCAIPGRCFRTDTPDATHMPVFHQIEGLVVDRNITFADLAGTIDAFTKAYFGGEFASRLRPSYFPFTEPSAEFDIQRPDGTWIELGGSGMVHPNVLRNCGLDPEEWQGFAFGFGIDRLAAARHGVHDLRDMFTNDIRFLTQF
jgi:phenylalanyl-tRNA synthetase alpha chain